MAKNDTLRVVGSTPRHTRIARPFLQHGFRPFFLGAALWAALAVPLWLALVAGRTDLPLALPEVTWHAHEMLFGFAIAVFAGFLLTAAPNWTGAVPLQGIPLGLLFGLWVTGRLAMLVGGAAPTGVAAAIDFAFLPVFAIWVGITLARHGNRRNFPFVGIVVALAVANALVHLDALDVIAGAGAYGLTLALDLVALLMTLVGGRVVPSFTANALLADHRATSIKPRPHLDRSAIIAVVAMNLGDLVDLGGVFAGALAIAAGGLNFARLAGWNGFRTLHSPILWVLHLGFLWLCVGLVLKGLGPWLPGASATAGLHALTVGAVGSMTLGVMSRAALGHSGRKLVAAPGTVAAYALVSVAALARLAGAILPPDFYLPGLMVAGLAWSSAFVLFTIVYWPIFTRPRADGRPF